MVTGLFYDRDSAERAYQGLASRGYTKDDVNLVMSDETRRRHFGDGGAKTELGNKAAEGAGIGGGVGGVLGAALAAVAATGTSIAVPGLGLVVAGPLAAALAGAGAGAATGGLLGGLIGAGIPEERVKRYESGLKNGGILMGVSPRSDEDASHLAQHWRSNSAQDVWSHDDGAHAGQGSNAGDTVVGVYDNHDDAVAAQRELLREGYSEHEVMLAHGNEGDTAGQEIDGDQMSYRGIQTMFNPKTDRSHHDLYAEAVRRGSHVLSVNVDGERQLEQAMAIMNRHNAVDIEERSTHWKNEGWSGYDAAAPRYSKDQVAQERSRYARPQQATEGTRIPVVEEQLAVGKREVQRGGVRVVKRMREIPVHESVELRSDHVRVERQAVDRPAGADAFREQTVEVRETAEEPVVQKTARVVEEVVVGKEVSEQTRNIHDTVRRTDVEVENLDASDAGISDDNEFRRHWQSAYGNAGGRYEDYDAAYRYGSSMAGSERFRNYQGEDWASVEPGLRSDWEKNNPGSAWDKVKDAVRYGAERVTGRRH
jgi:uncharacterized protein (TIGR02271 family)